MKITLPWRKFSLPKPRRSVSVLSVLVLLLAGSAGMRLASGAGQALAQQAKTPQPSAEQEVQPQPAVIEKIVAECPSDAELDAILLRLNDREARLAARSTEIAAREVTLKAAEERISKRIAELKQAEAQLTQSMAKTATAAEDDIASLVSVYAAMKPKDAAVLFEAMDPGFAAGFLRRMRPDAAAPIFAGMSPSHAYAVSAILAGRNAEVPTPPAPEKPDRG